MDQSTKLKEIKNIYYLKCSFGVLLVLCYVMFFSDELPHNDGRFSSISWARPP